MHLYIESPPSNLEATLEERCDTKNSVECSYCLVWSEKDNLGLSNGAKLYKLNSLCKYVAPEGCNVMLLQHHDSGYCKDCS